MSMYAFLGNLTVRDLEARTGLEFDERTRAELEAMRQDDARRIGAGRFHLFDMPLCIMAGDADTLVRVGTLLKPYASKTSVTVQALVADGADGTEEAARRLGKRVTTHGGNE